MQLYAEGLAALRSSDPGAAKDRLLEAVSVDPSNALGYAALSEAWSELGYDSKALDAARRAFDLSSSLDDLERLSIEARYRLVARDWKRAAELYLAIWNLVPESMDNATALVEAYRSSGRIEEATRVIARLRSLPPPLGDDPRIDLLETKLVGATWSDFPRMARLAGTAAEKARNRGMRALYAHARLTQSRAMWSAGEPGSADVRHEARALCEELHDSSCVALTLRSDGNASFIAGRLAEAQESYSQALALAREAGNVDEQLNDLNGLGLLTSSLGDFDAADNYFREAFRLSRKTLRAESPMLLNNRAGISTEAGRIPEARQEATDALAQARAGHQVESEADALAALALLDRISGDPRHAVELYRQALAVAKQSGKKLVIVQVGFALALALEDTGSAAAAQEALRTADSLRGSDDAFTSGLTGGWLSFHAGNYAGAERMARTLIEMARKDRSQNYELRAETLLARALLAEGRGEEARAVARQAVAIHQTPDVSLSRMEARFAEAAASGGELDGLAGMAQRSGYVQLALEIRLAAAEQAVRRGRSGAQRLLRDVMREAAAKGYTALAARAQSVN